MLLAKILMYAGGALSLVVAYYTVTSKKFWKPGDFKRVALLGLTSTVLIMASNFILEMNMVPYLDKMPPGKYPLVGFHILDGREGAVEFVVRQTDGREAIVRSTTDKFELKNNHTNKPNFAVFKPTTKQTVSFIQSLVNPPKSDIIDVYHK